MPLYRELPEIVDGDMEAATLGAILTCPELLPSIIADARITPSSFYLRKNQRVFEAILNLADKGTPPSTELVMSHLNGDVPEGYVSILAQTTPAPGNAVHYAKRVAEAERWRNRRDSVLRQAEALAGRNLNDFLRARAATDGETIDEAAHYTPLKLAADFEEYLNQPAGTAAFKLPFEPLNTALGGGLRQKQVTSIVVKLMEYVNTDDLIIARPYVIDKLIN